MIFLFALRYRIYDFLIRDLLFQNENRIYLKSRGSIASEARDITDRKCKVASCWLPNYEIVF
jgi:hypothetical protein